MQNFKGLSNGWHIQLNLGKSVA